MNHALPTKLAFWTPGKSSSKRTQRDLEYESLTQKKSYKELGLDSDGNCNRVELLNVSYAETETRAVWSEANQSGVADVD